MRLHLSFTATHHTWDRTDVVPIDLPMRVTLGEATFDLDGAPPEWPGFLLIHGSMAIDPSGLAVVEDLFRTGQDENSPLHKALDCPEVAVLTAYSIEVTSAVAFLTKTPLEQHVAFGFDASNTVESESHSDEALLQRLGTRAARTQLVGRPLGDTFRTPVITPRLVEALAERSGVRLFAEAMRAGTPVAQFRDLWRVLEMAFGEHSEQLVHLVAAYAPAHALGFTREELRELRTLRGKASHAASRGGSGELARVNAEVLNRLDRVKDLAERVILTKRRWNSSDLDIDALLPLESYVDADGVRRLATEEIPTE
jgi:hypothetical protein